MQENRNEKRNRSQYFNNCFFCVFSTGLGDTIKGWAFWALYEKNPRTFVLWPFLWKCGVRWMVMVPSSGCKTSLHIVYWSSSQESSSSREETCWTLSTYLRLQCCIYEKLHCARRIPGHGYNHTLFHQGVSVASFHILFKQWFLCVNCWRKRKKEMG